MILICFISHLISEWHQFIEAWKYYVNRYFIPVKRKNVSSKLTWNWNSNEASPLFDILNNHTGFTFWQHEMIFNTSKSTYSNDVQCWVMFCAVRYWYWHMLKKMISRIKSSVDHMYYCCISTLLEAFILYFSLLTISKMY